MAIFSGFLSFVQAAVPWRAKTVGKGPTPFGKIALEQVDRPAEVPQWSEGQLAPLAEVPRDQLDGFLHFGQWIKVQSSNVDAVHYDGETSELQIRFHNGSVYQYEDVSLREAEDFVTAVSQGKWVWDRLRVRGTVFGWRKPYTFLSGVSAAAPQWMRKASSRMLHGRLLQEGERNAKQLKELMPRGWKRAAAKFRK